MAAANKVHARSLKTANIAKPASKAAKATAVGLGASGTAKAGTGVKAAKDILTTLGILL